MARDRVHPLKMEDSASGGTELDPYPTGLNPQEDFLDARGLTVQNATSADEAVVVERDSEDNLTFTDPVAGTWTLDELTGGALTEEQHRTLRQLIHFIDNGPAEGFATGAYRETTGGLFPTAIVWYDSAGEGKKKIVEKLISWTGVVPTTIAWKVYDASEVLLATVTDTITYSGIFETSRSRAIVVA